MENVEGRIHCVTIPDYSGSSYCYSVWVRMTAPTIDHKKHKAELLKQLLVVNGATVNGSVEVTING